MRKIVFLIVILGLGGAFGIARYAKKSVEHIEIDKTHPNPKNNEAKIVELKDTLKTYPGKERAEMFVKLSVFLLDDERKMYMDELKVNLAKNEAEFVGAFFENLPKLKLKKEEYTELSTLVLTHKKEPAYQQHWQVAKDKFKEIGIILE